MIHVLPLRVNMYADESPGAATITLPPDAATPDPNLSDAVPSPAMSFSWNSQEEPARTKTYTAPEFVAVLSL